MQIAVVALCTFVLALVFGRLLIPALRALKAGQSIREIGPSWHNSKAGTPTMGGIMFIAAAILCVVAAGWRSMLAGYRTHLYVLAFALVFGLIGFIDDFVKVKFKRNLGLTALQKLVLQLAAAGAYLALLRYNGDLTCDLYIPFWNVTFDIPWLVYLIFAMFVIVGCVNAVNLTDGVDGLSSSVTIPVMAFFAVCAWLWGKTTLALLPAALVGGLAAFLGFCKDYFVINDFEKQLISVVKIQCIPHPFCNMDLPITKHSCNIRIKALSSYSRDQAIINSAVNRCSSFWGSAPLFFLRRFSRNSGLSSS